MFYIVSGSAVESIAAAAVYVDFTFALRDADIRAAAGTFEETVVLALGEAILPGGVLILPTIKVGEVGAVLHLTPVKLPRECADKGGDQRKDTEPNK